METRLLYLKFAIEMGETVNQFTSHEIVHKRWFLMRWMRWKK